MISSLVYQCSSKNIMGLANLTENELITSSISILLVFSFVVRNLGGPVEKLQKSM